MAPIALFTAIATLPQVCQLQGPSLGIRLLATPKSSIAGSKVKGTAKSFVEDIDAGPVEWNMRLVQRPVLE